VGGYAAYKESNVEWVGKIPTDWDAIRVRYLCDITTGNKDTVDHDDLGEYPFYVRSPIIEHIDTYSFDGEAVLTAGDGVGAGKVFHYVCGKFDYHQRVYNLHGFRRVEGRYLFYFMQENFYKEIERGNAKSTVDSIRLNMLQDFVITFPHKKERQRVFGKLKIQQTGSKSTAPMAG
jgi:type I restriction enzyme S subunit